MIKRGNHWKQNKKTTPGSGTNFLTCATAHMLVKSTLAGQRMKEMRFEIYPLLSKAAQPRPLRTDGQSHVKMFITMWWFAHETPI